MATYGCTVEWNGVNAVLKGQRGLSSVTRISAGAFVVNMDPIVNLAANEFTVSCTLCNAPVAAGAVVSALSIKLLVDFHVLYILVTSDGVQVDSSFDLVVDTYRS